MGADGEPRFTMLETIREYALEHLEQRGEAEVLRREHAHFFLALAEEADAKIIGAEQSLWLGRLEQEHDNLRAPLAWCQTPAGDVELGLRLAVALWWFWEIRGYFHEGRRWLEAMLARAPLRTKLRASALNGAGALAYDQSDYTAARTFHEESLSIRRELGDQRGIAVCLSGLAGVYDQPTRAARLLGVVAALLKNIGGHLDAIERALYDRNVAAAQAALGASQFAAAWAAGRAMPPRAGHRRGPE